MNGNNSRWVVLASLTIVVIILAVFLPYQLSKNQLPAISDPVDRILLQQDTPTPSILNLQNADQLVQLPIQSDANPTPKRNCTYSVLYWLAHRETWPYQVIINDLNYTQEEAFAIVADTPLDVSGVLFLQVHSAYLNIISGADPSDVRITILDASDWLSQHPSSSALTAEDQQRGLKLARALMDYNSGIVGPGLCSQQSSSNGNQFTGILTPDLSGVSLLETATQTVTATRSPTSVSTRASTVFPPGQSTPTATRDGSNNPTQMVTSIPATRTSVVIQPTTRPTQPPPPTSTQPPPPTSPPPTVVPPDPPTPTSPPPEEPTPTSPPP